MVNYKTKMTMLIIAVFMISLLSCALVFADDINIAEPDNSNINVEQSAAARDASRSEETLIPQADTADGSYTSKEVTCMSPDRTKTAEVVRQSGKNFDSILVTSSSKKSKAVLLENVIYTSIEDFNWIDNHRVAITGHINPSLEVYAVVDAEKNCIDGQYYGIGFNWNKHKTKLYFIETSPYFSPDRVSDKIVDNDGSIYYETQTGKSLTDQLSLADDEKTFTFVEVDNKNEALKKITATMDNNRKLIKQSETDIKSENLAPEPTN